MPSFPARTASFPDRSRTGPSSASFADEVSGTLARLIAYMMALALIAIGGIALWQHLPELTDATMVATAYDDWTESVFPTPSATASLPADRAMDADPPRLRGGL